jgi:hypothetical protein
MKEDGTKVIDQSTRKTTEPETKATLPAEDD